MFFPYTVEWIPSSFDERLRFGSCGLDERTGPEVVLLRPNSRILDEDADYIRLDKYVLYVQHQYQISTRVFLLTIVRIVNQCISNTAALRLRSVSAKKGVLACSD